jgi:hypothetical protein
MARKYPQTCPPSFARCTAVKVIKSVPAGFPEARMARRHNRTGRSSGDARHVRLHHWLLNSPAYLSLSPAARAVHVEIVRLYNGANNGRLALSVRTAAARCRIARNTAARALAELQDRGFVECVTPGAFSLKTRHAAEWRLTHHKCDASGQLPSSSFMRWKPPEKQNTVSIRTATVANEGQSRGI